ncbi:MAG: NAD(P)/FAD-dependent oxidoreductase [Candidatus Omnitrophota bacterium]
MTKKKQTNIIVIIGGGPAGMMAAISAALSGSRVTLVEKNGSLGKKLLLTGGGRCNLTNMRESREFIDHFSKTGDFLRDAFKLFDNKKLLKFFASKGLITKTEEKGRVFPVTDKASSVLDLLKNELNQLNVKILYNTNIKKIFADKNGIKRVICDDEDIIRADRVILATGGLSYKNTGSTGAGIKMAEKMGHKIVLIRPGLVSLTLKGNYPKVLQGLSLDKVKILFRAGSSKFISTEDSLLFTGWGISGPVTFSSSAKVVDWISDAKKVVVEIDIFPNISSKELEKRLEHELVTGSGKITRNVLKEIVPIRLADVILDIAEILPQKKANQITLKQRRLLVSLLKGMKFDVTGSASIEKAQVTRGGVSVKDIDPRTMQSKKVKGLYFAGEMIDVDGDCGGFNLQAAFSTGYLAGRSAGN